MFTLLYVILYLPETYLKHPMDLHQELLQRFQVVSLRRIWFECLSVRRGAHSYSTIQDHHPLILLPTASSSSGVHTINATSSTHRATTTPSSYPSYSSIPSSSVTPSITVSVTPSVTPSVTVVCLPNNPLTMYSRIAAW